MSVNRIKLWEAILRGLVHRRHSVHIHGSYPWSLLRCATWRTLFPGGGRCHVGGVGCLDVKWKDTPPLFCCSSVSEGTLRNHQHMEGKWFLGFRFLLLTVSFRKEFLWEAVEAEASGANHTPMVRCGFVLKALEWPLLEGPLFRSWS